MCRGGGVVCGRRRAGLREGRRGRVLLLLTKGLPGSGRGHGCGGVVRWVEAGPRLRGAPEARGVAEATEGGGGEEGGSGLSRLSACVRAGSCQGLPEKAV